MQQAGEREPTRTWPHRRWAVVALLPLTLAVGACGDDDDGDPGDDDLAQQAEDLAESTGALALAEGMRATLVAEDVGDDVDRRSTAVLQESAEDLPGDPEVLGITDADGDGRDDDGNVEVRVDDEVACLTVAPEGDVDVADGSC